jgi:peptidoglycan L-alanyl-D-glutamate endopeptidase CwlK
MNMDALVRAVQQHLGVAVDGRPGPETWNAIYTALIGAPVPVTREFSGKVDARSEGVIEKLLPEVREYARALVKRAAAISIEVKVIGGLRTYAEQDALYAQGRTQPGQKVTNAKGGESNHNFGIAFDVGIFEGRNYLPASPAYDVVGAIGTEIGLEWGGHWTSLIDKPHYQLRPDWATDLSEREMLVELRKRVQNNMPIYD